MKKPIDTPNRADLLWLFERLVKVPAEAGDEFVDKIPTHVALYVLELAKQAPWPRGPHTKRTNAWRKEWLVLHWAHERKRDLEDRGLSATAALAQAAEEASQRSHLSAGTIKDRMQRSSRC